MGEEREYSVVYDGDYVNGCFYRRHVDYLDDAFELYAGACKRAMKNKIKANHLLVVRNSDRMVFAECSVWYPPITFEEVRRAHCEGAGCEYRIADVRGEIEALRRKADELERGLR